MSTCTVTDESPFVKILDIHLEAQEVDRLVKLATADLARRVRVPGFRPGKAPLRALRLAMGAERVQEELKERLIGDSYGRSLHEHRLEPVSVLQVDAPAVNPGEAFSYKIKIEVFPRLELPDMTTLGVAIPEVTVDDAEVEKALKAIQQEQATSETVDRAVKAGDWVSFSITAAPAGYEEKLEEIKETRFVVKLDQRPEGDAFLEHFPGKAVGEKVSFETAIGAAFPVEALSGAEGGFTFEIREVREPSLPAVDDDLAAQLKQENVEQLKTTLGSLIRRDKQREADRELNATLMDALMAKVTVELSPTMLSQELDNVKASVMRRTTLEEAAKEENLDVPAFEEKLKTETGDYLKRQLILRQIMSDHHVHVHDQEIMAALVQIASSNGMNRADMRKLAQNRNVREEIHERLLQEKTLRCLRDLAAGKNPATCDHGHDHDLDEEHEHEHAKESTHP